MAPTTRKTTDRATGLRKTPRARHASGSARPVSLSEASPSKQKKFFQAVRRLMREEGLQGDLVGVSLAAPVSRGRVAVAAVGCPAGQVRRVVCVKRPNGTIVCRSECQAF